MTLLTWTSLALASPGMAGAAHLGSLPVEPDSVWAGTGGIALWSTDDVAAGALGVEVGAGFGERFVVDVQLGTDVEVAGAFPSALAARYLLVDGPGARVAATFTSFVLPLRDGHEIGDWSSYTAHSPGVALDAGSERVRFDLAVPVWGVTSYDGYFGLSRTPFPLGATLGVNWLVSDRGRLRLGLPELLSYGWRSEKVYFDVGGFTLLAFGAVWSKLGFVF